MVNEKKGQIMADNTNTLTEGQAKARVIRAINREIKRDRSQVHDLVSDAIALREFNIRKLATVAEAEGKLEVKFDSYLSYMSNAKGIAAMFDFDQDAFDEFIVDCELGLRGLFDAFRQLFGPQPEETEDEAGDAGEESAENEAGESSPFEVIMSLLAHCSQDELSTIVDTAASLALADAA